MKLSREDFFVYTEFFPFCFIELYIRYSKFSIEIKIHLFSNNNRKVFSIVFYKIPTHVIRIVNT